MTLHFIYLKVILSACLMVGASIGLCFYSAGAFYAPLAAGLGISVGAASASTTFMLVFMALSALAVPFLLRRLRFLDLMLIGTALCAGSVLALAFSFNTVWVYLFSSLMGAGAALIGLVPANTLVQNWFEKRRSWTTSIVLAGSALTAALFSPVFSAGISALGWRMGFVIEAVFVLVLMLPMLLWKIELSPARVGMVPYGQGSGAPEPASSKIPNFVLWTFALIAVLSAILIALPLHYSTLASSLGIPALTGASMLSMAMIGNLVFKLLGGWISSRIKPVWTTALLDLCALIGTIGILICILSGARGGLPVLAFFCGSAFALSELSIPLLVSIHVGRRHFSILYAVLNCLSTMTTAFAIMCIGYMYDALRSYTWMYVLAIVAEVIIAALLWLLIRNQKADDVVNSAATRSLVLKVRDFEAKVRADHARKAAERKEAQAKEKARQANEHPMSEQDVYDSSVVVPENQAAPVIKPSLKAQMDLVDSSPIAKHVQVNKELPTDSAPAESAAPETAEAPVKTDEAQDNVAPAAGEAAPADKPIDASSEDSSSK